jgi:hypothetical protein
MQVFEEIKVDRPGKFRDRTLRRASPLSFPLSASFFSVLSAPSVVKSF